MASSSVHGNRHGKLLKDKEQNISASGSGRDETIVRWRHPRIPADWPPEPASRNERIDERYDMVAYQMEAPADGRAPIDSSTVLNAMRAVPRHVFLPASIASEAYRDTPLPIGHGQTISQPYIVALMTQLLGVSPSSRILEIGTGSGYQAAVLSHLTPFVHTIERIPALAADAATALNAQGYRHVMIKTGDGWLGAPETAPFDGIIITCATTAIPETLYHQLIEGGRLVLPLESPDGAQMLTLIRKMSDGSRTITSECPVRFVPLQR